jgi:hypothetical protein
LGFLAMQYNQHFKVTVSITKLDVLFDKEGYLPSLSWLV